jgi:NifU-like protein involved in Fe-S cluster formation
VNALQYPTALANSAVVRGLIDKQCELLRAVQLHPALARCTNLSLDEIEQTIAAHQLALRYLRETP